MIRITHHRIKCIGCGYCEEGAPYRWQIDSLDGKAKLLGSIEKRGIYTCNVSDDELEQNEEVAKLCPVKIIKVEKIR
jgi:ferredoxin